MGTFLFMILYFLIPFTLLDIYLKWDSAKRDRERLEYLKYLEELRREQNIQKLKEDLPHLFKDKKLQNKQEERR